MFDGVKEGRKVDLDDGWMGENQRLGRYRSNWSFGGDVFVAVVLLSLTQASMRVCTCS